MCSEARFLQENGLLVKQPYCKTSPLLLHKICIIPLYTKIVVISGQGNSGYKDGSSVGRKTDQLSPEQGQPGATARGAGHGSVGGGWHRLDRLDLGLASGAGGGWLFVDWGRLHRGVVAVVEFGPTLD